MKIDGGLMGDLAKAGTSTKRHQNGEVSLKHSYWKFYVHSQMSYNFNLKFSPRVN